MCETKVCMVRRFGIGARMAVQAAIAKTGIAPGEWHRSDVEHFVFARSPISARRQTPLGNAATGETPFRVGELPGRKPARRRSRLRNGVALLSGRVQTEFGHEHDEHDERGRRGSARMLSPSPFSRLRFVFPETVFLLPKRVSRSRLRVSRSGLRLLRRVSGFPVRVFGLLRPVFGFSFRVFGLLRPVFGLSRLRPIERCRGEGRCQMPLGDGRDASTEPVLLRGGRSDWPSTVKGL